MGTHRNDGVGRDVRVTVLDTGPVAAGRRRDAAGRHRKVRDRTGARRVARTAAVTVALSATAAATAASVSATADAATVLTVAGNGLLVRSPMSEELGGALCQGGNVCRTVDYPNSAIGGAALQVGFVNLGTAITSTPGPKVVMAYSQGGIIATMWLTQHAADTSDSQTMFVVFGNPQSSRNGLGPSFGSGVPTPTDTVHRIIDVCREYDSECDWPDHPLNFLAMLNAAAGYLTVHLDYTGVDVTSPTNRVQTVGNTTFVLVPTDDLPLLEPLRRLGLTGLADRLNAQLKPIVDAGYDRSGYQPLGGGTIDGFPTSSTSARSMQSSTLAAAAPHEAGSSAIGSATLPPPTSTTTSVTVDAADAVAPSSTPTTPTPGGATPPNATPPNATPPDATPSVGGASGATKNAVPQQDSPIQSSSSGDATSADHSSPDADGSSTSPSTTGTGAASNSGSGTTSNAGAGSSSS